MSIGVVGSLARKIADLISDGRYDLAIHACSSSRLTEADIERVIASYGRTFIRSPADFNQHIDAVLIKGRSVPTWAVRAPLWTQQEGRSDLTLELTIAENLEGPSAELDDLRVL